MTRQTINNGESGLTIRTNLNANFTELYSMVGPKLGVIVDGDSLGARNWNELGVTTLTQTGGVASVTATGLNAVVGAEIQISNVTNADGYNGRFTVTSASGTTATFAVDSSLPGTASTTRSQILVASTSQRTAEGDYVWAEMANALDYTLIDVVAAGGRTLAQINADYATLGPGQYKNCLIDFCGGTNDPKNGIATATSSAELEAYIVKAIADGHTVLLNTVPPLAGAANTTAVKQFTLALNKEIKRLGVLYKQPVYDKYAALVDPAAAELKAGNFDTSDNIHQSPTAGRINGTAKAPIFQAYCPRRPINLPATTSDTIGVINTSTNIIDGFFAGTGGSGGAGQIATGWTLTPTTITVTGSKGTGAVGATQILTLSGSSGSFTFLGTSVHASVVAGGVYELTGKLVLANFAAGIRATIALAATINTFAGEARALATRNATSLLPTDSNITFRSEPFTVPAGASVTLFRPSLVVVTTAAPGGTETITLERWAINRIG